MANYYNENFKILKERFPKIANKIENISQDCNDVYAQETQDGCVVFYKNQCLDHATKPIAAAQKWIKGQQINKLENIIIFGFGTGYHIEEIFNTGYNGKCVVIVSSCEAFKKALEVKDQREILNKLENIICSDDKESQKNYLSKSYSLIIRPQEQSLFYNDVANIKSFFYGQKGFDNLNPRIGILGPFSGGTLPMVVYLKNAFKEINQNCKVYDMSPFKSAFEYASDMVHDDFRKKIVEANFVEVTASNVVEAIKEKPIDILIVLAQGVITQNTLKQIKELGVITVLWFVEDYVRFTYWKHVAQYYDFVFTIQKGDCIDEIKKAGAGYVSYLPVACDPSIHKKISLTKEEQERWGSPISFVGAGYHNRQQFFASMCELPFKIWGTEWPTCKPFDQMVQEEGRRLTPAEYIKIFNASKININLHSSTEKDGVDPDGDFVNPRTVELASSEAFQLVDKRSLLSEMFEDGKEVVTFTSRDDLLQKIDYYLHHEDERQKIIQNAKARALKDHTYANRVKEILATIYSQKYEYLKNRIENSPWTKLLNRVKPYKELEERCIKAYKRGEEPTLDALVSDIVAGKGDLTDTEKKLLFLHHIRAQMIRLAPENAKLAGARR